MWRKLASEDLELAAGFFDRIAFGADALSDLARRVSWPLSRAARISPKFASATPSAIARQAY
jgi:hypothetical protein